MKVAVVGATGLVGSVMLKVLEERNFPVTELIPVATEKSVGKEVEFKSKKYKVVNAETAISMKPAIALFSAGGSTSLELAPKFAEAGTTVIDNSSAWRMDPTKKLVVPEINAHELTKNDKIIANPNCSTIQMVVVLSPLHKKYKVRRVVVSTYQSVTGSGAKALRQLEDETIEYAGSAWAQQNNVSREATNPNRFYPYQIHRNVLPQVDVFTDNGYTKEELKMVNETKKILGDDNVRVTATTVRVPVKGGHSESVNVELATDFKLEDVRSLLASTHGVVLNDEPSQLKYPMPIDAEGKDDVFVGRLRRDESQPNTLNMWIVSDNLRKGAATNAVQIAEYLVEKKLV